jgi:hypothetical protein
MTAHIGQAYAFQATATDADSETLTFTAANLPSWARLDAATGHISGTPAAGDAGTYDDVTLTVSDGVASASLAPFTITVEAESLALPDGRVTLSWAPPIENTDGSALVDLASYRILYGRSKTNLSRAINIDNPSVNNYVVERLAVGTWYFAVVAVNTDGGSSAPSNVTKRKVS